MRVLWIVRADLERRPGGDTTQIRGTAAALRELGHQVELTSAARPGLGGFDLAHLFHLDRLWENLPHARRLAAAGRPAVLSTIWWPTAEFDACGRHGSQAWIARACGTRAYPTCRVAQRSCAAWVRSGLRWDRRPVFDFLRAAREFLDAMRVLLPNSRAEARQIEEHFGAGRQSVVVPNAAEGAFFTPGPAAPRAGVVCVGRIEPRKNQLALVAALRECAVPLTLVGRAGRFSAAYARRCRRAAGPAVEFTGDLDRQAVRERLRRARVHVCPSWYETPGLASLEAALSGCRIVVTPGGCTEEYYGDLAHYVAPDDRAALRNAVLDVLERPSSNLPTDDLRARCSWQAAARATLAGYEQAMASVSAPPDPPMALWTASSDSSASGPAAGQGSASPASRSPSLRASRDKLPAPVQGL